MPTCTKPHRYNPIFGTLPDDQKVYRGRHKCAACAYETGYDDGFSQRSPHFERNALNESQIGEVRHKSCEAAYNLGYYHGLERHTATF